MKTANQARQAWIRGNKREAYNLSLQDEGSLNISFDRFCELMPDYVKKHNEMTEAIEAHSRLIMD